MPYYSYWSQKHEKCDLQAIYVVDGVLDPEVLEELEVQVEVPHALYRAPYHDHLQEPDWGQDYL